jgi:hypothetical protein
MPRLPFRYQKPKTFVLQNSASLDVKPSIAVRITQRYKVTAFIFSLVKYYTDNNNIYYL